MESTELKKVVDILDKEDDWTYVKVVNGYLKYTSQEEKMKMKLYCYSMNGEEFASACYDRLKDAKKDALAEAKENGLNHYFIGECIPVHVTEKVVSATFIMENIQKNMEHLYCMDFDVSFDNLTNEDYDELSKQIASTVSAYLKKVGKDDFPYLVKNVREYAVDD